MIYFLILAVMAVITVITIAQQLGSFDIRKWLINALSKKNSKKTTSPPPKKPGPNQKPNGGQKPNGVQKPGKKPIGQHPKHISAYYRLTNSDVPVYPSTFKSNVTEKECEKLCNERPKCMAYDYIPATNLCNINKIVLETNGINTGMRRKNGSFKMYKNTELKYGSPNSSVTKDQKLCSSKCGADSKCHWFTYNTKNSQCSQYTANLAPGHIHAQRP